MSGPEPERAADRWAGPSRRARLLAVAGALAFALLTFAIVNGVWRRAAPPLPPPQPVEVKVVPSPPVGATGRLDDLAAPKGAP